MIRNLLYKSKNLSGILKNQYSNQFFKKKVDYFELSTLNRGKMVDVISFNFSAQLGFSRQEFEQIIKQNTVNDVNADTLLYQFINNIRKVEQPDFAKEVGEYYLQIFKLRMEYDRAISICKTMNLMQKDKFKQKFNLSVIYFTSELVELNFKIANFRESNILAHNLYYLYFMNKESLQYEYLYQLLKHLSSQMIKSEQYSFASNYLGEAQRMFDEDNTVDLSNKFIVEIYYQIAGYYFLCGNFSDSIRYAQKATEILKQNSQVLENSHYIQIIEYLCYKSTNQISKSEQILVEIQKEHQEMNGIKLEDLNDENFKILPLIKDPISIEEQEINEQIKQDELQEKLDDSKTQIDKLDIIGLEFLKKGEYFQGIQYYEQYLNQLDSSKDYKKIAQISERLVTFYGQIKNYDKVIEILQNSFNLYAMKRRYFLLNDRETYMMLSNLKKYYFLRGEYSKSIEWGKKWHIYSQKYNLFAKFNYQQFNEQFSLIQSYQSLKMYEEALDYTNVTQKYLQKAKQDKEILEYQLNKILCELNLASKKQKEAIENLKKMSDYLIQFKDQDNQSKQDYYKIVKQTAFICLDSSDFDGTYYYGNKYLQERKNQEKEESEDDIEKAFNLSYTISFKLMKNKSYHDSELFAQEAIRIAQEINKLELKFKSQILLCKIYLAENKVDLCELELIKSEDIYIQFSNENVRHSNQKDTLNEVKSQFYLQKKDYVNWKKYFDMSEENNWQRHSSQRYFRDD